MSEEDQTYDLSDAAAAVRRRAPLVALITLAFAAAALAVSLAQPDRYEATAVLLIRDLGLESRFIDAPVVLDEQSRALDSQTNIGLASLDEVDEATARVLPGSETADEISDSITIRPGLGADLVEVIAEQGSPAEAVATANAFAETFLEMRRVDDREAIQDARRTFERDLRALSPQERDSAVGDELRRQVADLRTLELLQTGGAELAEPATPPDESTASSPVKDAGLGAFAGLIFGLAAALALEWLGPGVRSRRDFERAFGAPVLASVPVAPELAQRPLEPLPTEALRTLWTRLRYLDRDDPPRSILLVSATAGEGRSSIALQLALVAAVDGARVTVVEADLRRPTLASRASVEPAPGLSEVVGGEVDPAAAIRSLPAGSGAGMGVELIAAGGPPASPTSILASPAMAELLEGLSSSRDLVLIDPPALGEVADAIPLLGLVDGILIVADGERLRRRDAIDLRRQLDEMGARVLGVVVNRSSDA